MRKNTLRLLFVICLVLIICISMISFYKKTENFNDKNTLFSDLMNNHYQLIFPNNANRNSAGFRFFKYIYDNLAINEELFDIYNTFYCGVSGSIVSPERPDNFDILKVKDENNNCVFGKYYRCCTPCNCDIMKYAKVIRTKIAIPKNSNNYYYKNLLTIGDPCIDETKFPNEIDINVFKCSNNLLEKAYRVNENKEITTGNGRLIIGVLYPLDSVESNELVSKSLDICLSGTKRLLSSPEELKYGMGDIFVKLALINNNENYSHTINDLCQSN